jgi:hypothetical protein
MSTVETPTLTPARPPATAAEAAHALQQLLERVVPVDDRPAVRASLHTAAQTLLGTLHGGASAVDVLTRLVAATAPPAPLPPFEPWKLVLGLSFDEFAQAGAGLHVALPKLAEAIWLTSDEAIQAALVQETRLWHRFIKDIGWMRVEADQLKLPKDQRTVGRFIEALGGRVIGWRAPQEGRTR